MNSNRRRYIQNLGICAAGITPGGTGMSLVSCTSFSENKADDNGQVLFTGDNIALVNAKSKQQPPVYLAWFGWQPPLFDKWPSYSPENVETMILNDIPN